MNEVSNRSNTNRNGNHDDSVALVQDLVNYLSQNNNIDDNDIMVVMEELVEVFLGDELTRLVSFTEELSGTNTKSSSIITDITPNDDSLVALIKEMMNTVQTTFRNDSDPQNITVFQEQFKKVLDLVYQAAFQIAGADQTNTNTNRAANTTSGASFSLLLDSNQFQFNTERVTAEKILQCCSTMKENIENAESSFASQQETLCSLLENIDHLDDISYMWEDIRLMLLEQLQHSKNYIPYLWNLTTDQHQQPEYLSMRYDLCWDIVKQISNYNDSKNFEGSRRPSSNKRGEGKDDHSSSLSSTMALSSLWNTWHTMWCQFLKSHSLCALSEQDVDTMAHHVWIAVVKNDTNNDTTSSSNRKLSCFGTLALLDPYAFWFSRWIYQISVDRLLKVLKETKFLEFVWNKIVAVGMVKLNNNNNDSTTTAIETNNNNTRSANDNCDDDDELNESDQILIESACHIHALCILQSILATTRVSQFPFESLVLVEENKGDEEQQQLQHDILSLYLTLLSRGEVRDDKVIHVCLQAIETMLMGTNDSVLILETYRQLLLIFSSCGDEEEEDNKTNKEQGDEKEEKLITLKPMRLKQQLCYTLATKVLFEKDWNHLDNNVKTKTSSSTLPPPTKFTVVEMILNFMEQQQQNYDEKENDTVELLQLSSYGTREFNKIRKELQVESPQC